MVKTKVYKKAEKSQTKKRIKIARIILILFSSLVALFLLSFGAYSIYYSNKIYAHQKIGSINYSHKSKSEAKALLEDRTSVFIETKILLNFKGQDQEKVYLISPNEIGLKYDADATVDKMWNVGRSGGAIRAFGAQLKSLFFSTNHQAEYSLDEDSLNAKIKAISDETDHPEKDYNIEYQSGEYVLLTERKEGDRIDQDEIKADLKRIINQLSDSEINFATKMYKPHVEEGKARKRLEEANKILAAGDLALTSEGQEFKVDADSIGGMLKAKISKDDLELYLEEERLKVLVESIAKGINAEPQNSKLTVVGGQAKVFEPARIGKTLDQIQTRVDIKNAIFSRIDPTIKSDPKKINLKVEIKKPEITDDAIEKLGIKELVGTGSTTFKGSPSNRIHNITVGAGAINGVLIKPGETFSTLKRLGTIDASSGYLEELVIKENRTVPEFGGGLCQVSSTLFRAAMNAGVEIIERQNHKYRVSYYEPPVGMDATIYDPAPDFKFKNNYSTYLLVQSRVEGTKITFDIYGTKDDRQVEISTPEVYDIVNPEPPINIETDTLPPGERKLIEKSHPGASAKFNYKVTRGSDVLQQKTFVSKYVAWQERWLVGKSAQPVPAAPEPVAPATPTPPQPTPLPPTPPPSTPSPTPSETPTPSPL